MRERIFLKSGLLVLVLVFGMATSAAAQEDGACLEETLVSSELADILGWSAEATVGFTLMEVLQAGIIKTYCFPTKAGCEESQEDASGGTKSGCYPSGGQYCYDLQFSSTSSSASSGTGNFYGTVTDSTAAPVPGVTVTLEGQGSPQVQVTNAQGEFRYLGVARGTWKVNVELAGFDTSGGLVIVATGRNTTRDFELIESEE